MNVRFFYIDRKMNINYIHSECITHFKTFLREEEEKFMGSFSVRKRFICFSVLKALTAAAVLTVMSCGEAVAVENIKVTPTALSLGIGETAVLKAEVEPADASVNAVLWSVTQGTAVTVDGDGDGGRHGNRHGGNGRRRENGFVYGDGRQYQRRNRRVDGGRVRHARPFVGDAGGRQFGYVAGNGRTGDGGRSGGLESGFR